MLTLNHSTILIAKYIPTRGRQIHLSITYSFGLKCLKKIFLPCL